MAFLNDFESLNNNNTFADDKVQEQNMSVDDSMIMALPKTPRKAANKAQSKYYNKSTFAQEHRTAAAGEFMKPPAAKGQDYLFYSMVAAYTR